MNQYTEKYKKIVDELIKKSFPILKSNKIVIMEGFLSKPNAGVLGYLPINFIFLNKKLRISTGKQLTGIFAHELCHLEVNFKRGYIKNFFNSLRYYFPLSSFRRDEERKIDLLVIKKGYGRELYEVAKELKHKKLAKYYLSPQEIKKYAKSIGKW